MVTGVWVFWREMYGEVQLLYYNLENDINLIWGCLHVFKNT